MNGGKQTKRRLNIGIVPGSWVSPESYTPLTQTLQRLGHTAIVVDTLPVDILGATRDDYVQAIQHKLGRDYLDILMLHSASAQHYDQIVEYMGDLNLGRVVMLAGSFGMPAAGALTAEQLAGLPKERNTTAFRNGIRTRADGKTKLCRAGRLFFNDVSRFVAGIGKSLMRWEYRLADAPLPKPLRAPGTYLLGDKDVVRREDWARSVCNLINLQFELMDGGHNLQFTQPDALARKLESLAPDMPDGPTIGTPRPHLTSDTVHMKHLRPWGYAEGDSSPELTPNTS